ncbi:MAG: HNH endonuclease [bacterium]|nr:HNH endonuclease [bacterium]
MTTIALPDFAENQPAPEVDAALRQALAACDRARECAVLWFAEVQKRELYRELGHASLQIYARVALGFSDNRYWQFKRLADDLERLPVLRAAVASGEVGWTKAQQVARVATAETQSAWVAQAAASGRRALAVAIKSARRQDAPAQLSLAPVPAVPAATAVSTTISLRADGLQRARFEALIEKAYKLGLVAAGAERLDVILDGLEALVAAAAAPSSGPAVQVIVHKCPECEAAAVVTSLGEQALAPAQVAALACDARVREPGGANKAIIPPKVRASVLARDRHRCATPGCGATRFLEVHHVVPRSLGGSNREENLVTMCSRCHAFAHEKNTQVAVRELVPGVGASANR